MRNNNQMADMQARQRRMRVLALSDAATLHSRYAALGTEPGHSLLRGPETGLVMLRGRIGGVGEAFNLGEATVTRATVKLHDGSVGHAMALGRVPEKVRQAAVIDALCRDEARAARIDAELIAPIEEALAKADEKRRQETAATRVDFFTLVRGED